MEPVMELIMELMTMVVATTTIMVTTSIMGTGIITGTTGITGITGITAIMGTAVGIPGVEVVAVGAEVVGVEVAVVEAKNTHICIYKLVDCLLLKSPTFENAPSGMQVFYIFSNGF